MHPTVSALVLHSASYCHTPISVIYFRILHFAALTPGQVKACEPHHCTNLSRFHLAKECAPNTNQTAFHDV